MFYKVTYDVFVDIALTSCLTIDGYHVNSINFFTSLTQNYISKLSLSLANIAYHIFSQHFSSSYIVPCDCECDHSLS